jgi:hypothetical protein
VTRLFSTLPAMNETASADQAFRTVCDVSFHRTLWVPETPDHPKLKVTYATTTNFNNVNLPAVLFIGPMFSTRWVALHIDKLARDCGVRVICVDRYGADLGFRNELLSNVVRALEARRQ